MPWSCCGSRRGSARKPACPADRIIYTDTRAWGEVEKPLYDAQLGLTGKPDYLVEQNGQIIPVEVKSGQARRTPLTIRTSIKSPPTACSSSAEWESVRPTASSTTATAILPWTTRLNLESNLLDVLAEMRRDEVRTNVPRSHEVPARCQSLRLRDLCDQKLS